MLLAVIAATLVSSQPYPVGSPNWNALVVDSYTATKSGDPIQFAAWFEQEFSLAPWTNAHRAEMQRAKNKDLLVEDIVGSLHRAIKRAIPKFDLDGGFEFANVPKLGERQCLLQSVMLAGMLQVIDIDAGVVMVWRNESGQASNNGHCATLVKFPSGKLMLADCSEPRPFAKHQGLFVTSRASYKFVEPKYDASGRILSPANIESLPYRFVRSQFDFYRAERTQRGLLAEPSTKQGLAESLNYMKKAIAQDGQNPLAVYSLGRVYRKMGKLDDAKKWFARALPLYQRFGMVPQGLKDALQSVGLK